MRLTVLHPNPALTRRDKLTVDIVAVHGLNGNETMSWTDPKSKKLWLQDFLPADIEGARVMTFGYNAETAFKTSADIFDYARGLLRRLVDHRQESDEKTRPIVFIVHSLGGIIVKQALVLAHAEAQYRGIKDKTVGIFFFGTPHNGSKYANYGKVLAGLATALMNRPSSKLLATLQSDSHILTTLTKNFSTLITDFQIATFYELKPMSGFSSLIVEKESAILSVEGEDPQGVDADHRNICKFRSKDDETYQTLIKRLRLMLSSEAIVNTPRHPESYNTFYEVPHNVSSIFTGRDDISGKLRAKCLPVELPNTQREHKVFVLYGLGGIGKTQVCLNFAQSHRERFWGIFFVDVSSMSTAEHSFSELAHSCQVGDSAETFKRWLGSSTEHWLLVLDNADDTSLGISTFFPKGARGTIIITTRNPDCIVHSTVGSASLDKMSSDEATTLLLKASGADVNDQSFRGRAQPVLQLLGSLPLAIIHAGAAIRQELYTYEEYREAFADGRKELLSLQNVQAGVDYKSTVYAAWDLSVNAIRKDARGGNGVPKTTSVNAQNALELLTVFGFCYFDDIVEEMWQVVWEFLPRVEKDQWWMSNIIRMFREDRSSEWDPQPFRQAVNLLSKYSLINRTNGRISLHPLVHSWIRDSLSDDKLHLQWWTTTLTMLVMVAQPKSKEMFRRQRLFGLHINACLKVRDIGDLFVEDDSAVARAQVINQLLIYEWRGVDLEDSLLLAQRAVEYFKKVFDEDDPRLWRCFDSAASMSNDLEQWQGTVDLLEAKVISYLDTRRISSEYSTASLDAMWRLIRAYRKAHRTPEALELVEKVLEICKESRGKDHQITLEIEETLAPIYYDLSRKDVALEMSQTVYSKIEALMGEDSLRCLTSKTRLAFMYKDMGHPEKALDMLRQILERTKLTLPEDHYDTLSLQYCIARVYRTLGRPEDGIPLLVDALEKSENAGVLARRVQKWRTCLEELQVMEAEQLSQRIKNSSAVGKEEPKGERGVRLWLKNRIQRK